MCLLLFKREKASARASSDRFPCPCPCPLSLIKSNYPKSTSTHSELPNILKNPNRIPKEFPKNSQRIPKEFPKYSDRIHKQFTNNFQIRTPNHKSLKYSKEFPKNSPFIRLFTFLTNNTSLALRGRNPFRACLFIFQKVSNFPLNLVMFQLQFT